MSIIRIQKNKENPYVIINKLFLEDSNISLRLKGFLAYCLSKPDDWKFHVRQLASVLKEGKDAIYTIIDEGIENGYIERTQQKINGKFETTDYIIHETKIQKKITVSDFPDPDCPDTETPVAEIPTLLINEEELCNEENIYTEAKAPEPPPFPPSTTKRKKALEQKVEVKPRVFITPSQAEALSKRIEGSNIDIQALYQELSDWKISKEIWGGSDYSSIIKWVIDAVQKKIRDKANVPLAPNVKTIQDRNDTERGNRDLGKRIIKKYQDLFKCILLAETNNGIEFNMGDRGGIIKVPYQSTAFKEQCFKYLRHLNQDTTGL